MIDDFDLNHITCRHKTRIHIGQLVKETSVKLKEASETDLQFEVSVRRCAVGFQFELR